MQTNYNPDVLSCLANLSNDEVFTPPALANSILDLLPSDIWHNKDATFLDPCSKTGVFLREIAKRLIAGLETEIPDLQQRINHIFKNQLFGIAITELTAHLTRRSVYCSKNAHGNFSVCDSVFDDDTGNIIFDRIDHTWVNGKCKFCGANQENYERGWELESHAYQFIHYSFLTADDTDENTDEHRFREIMNMKFDVIVGNPPYQLGDGGGTGSSAIPLYHRFIQQAKKMNPRYLSMIIPARWFSGGRALDEFRDEMLHDERIRVIHDYPNSSDCFAGVQIEGGVCFFLWDRDNKGKCKVCTHQGNNLMSEFERDLLEKDAETFIRYNEAVSILRKTQSLNENSFAEIISANDPFGFDVRVENSYKRIHPKFEKAPFADSVVFYYNGWKKDGIGYIEKEKIQKNSDLVDTYKVYISKAYGMGNNIPTQVINDPIIGEKNTCCTETYLLIGPLKSKHETMNVISYMKTKFFRFMVMLIKNTQNAMKKVYSFVPMQDFSEAWTDEKLYKKYDLSVEEIQFIESMIRPMEGKEEE